MREGLRARDLARLGECSPSMHEALVWRPDMAWVLCPALQKTRCGGMLLESQYLGGGGRASGPLLATKPF